MGVPDGKVVLVAGGGQRGGDEGTAGSAGAVAAEIRPPGGEAASTSDSVGLCPPQPGR